MAAETVPNDQVGSSSSVSRMPIEEEQVKGMETPDLHNAAMKIDRAKEAYITHTEIQEKPTKIEIWFWYLYGLCSYFILTVLVPIVFPLIISQIVKYPQETDPQGWGITPKGIPCWNKQIELYKRLTHGAISLNSLKFSAMEWTLISWVIGLILSIPLSEVISNHLDYGNSQHLIVAAATAIGSLFCLPVGLFRTPYTFPVFIAPIISSHIIATASHTRHLGLVIREFSRPTLQQGQFPIRRGVSGWFSLYATAAGCLGSAIISAFTYQMLRNKKDPFVSLWIVSIFSGLKWLIGMSHALFIRTGEPITSSTSSMHFLTFFKYPHALGSLIVVFLSSFTSMCIFNGGLLHFLGQLCLKPLVFLYFWLIYFIFPSFSLPLLQPMQHVIKADSVKMQQLGFLLALLTSGMGFYYREKNWHRQHILFFAAIQSTSAGLLHAFGRVLLLDCTPHGKEGAFSMGFSWTRALGTCAGFAVASSVPGNVGTPFGVSFCAATIGIIILIFGNISNIGGAKAAGHLHADSERGSPVCGLDTSIVIKESVPVHQETD